MDRHAQGVLLIVISAIAFSSAGFFTRLIHLDVWSMLFWRGLFAGLMILCVIVVQERRPHLAAIRAVGRPGLAAAICSTAATFLYINALRRTSVADVAVIFAAAPFLTAGLGWLWLRLTVDWTTLGRQSSSRLLGIGIMVGGAAIEGHLFGDLLAFGMTVCMAIMMLIIRRHEHTTHAAGGVSVGTAVSSCALAVLPPVRPRERATWSTCSCSAPRSSAWGCCC